MKTNSRYHRRKRNFNKWEQQSYARPPLESIRSSTIHNKYIQLPQGYENDKTANELFNRIENSNDSFFITGKAGTGKSTFIHFFKQQTKKQVLLLSFTGIAAINIGGQTIHSFFVFPLKPFLPNDPDIKTFKANFEKRKILEKVDTIIIDEVSMLRSDLLEALNQSLRKNGGDPHKIFGGKQLLLVGDPFQLPPVVNAYDRIEDELFNSVYASEYFFDSISYKKLMPTFFEFHQIHRQHDIGFIKLLNQVRDCTIDRNGINQLNSRFNKHFVQDDFTALLTSTNALAKKENNRKLSELSGTKHFFYATIDGEFSKDKYPTESCLELKVGAQIMMIRNDMNEENKRWANGTIAQIEKLDEDSIIIKLENGDLHRIEKEVWENRQYRWDKVNGRISINVVGVFEQYPIKLAWAITIHKSQGLTFDKVAIDLGRGAFACGQLYTALSRCRTLEGITLKKKIREEDIIKDMRLTTFFENEKGSKEARKQGE